MRKLFVVLFVISILLAACAGPAGAGIEVTEPMAMAAKAGDVTGVFMQIKNNGAEDDHLLGASSDVAETVQVHETVMDGDVMKMQEVGEIHIDAGATVKLEHGGYHIMLINLKKDLDAGQMVTVTLEFEKAGEVTVTAMVMAK